MRMITVRLNPAAAEPLYEQLYTHIKAEIIGGQYPCEAKLPSKRQLAAYLQCSQNTVQAAYGQLAAEGYLAARPKSGFYVCRLDGILNIGRSIPPALASVPQPVACRYDFSHHGVDLDSFPFTTWRRLTKDILNEYDADLLKASDPQGYPDLRASIASYLHNSRGVRCAPEQIIVSSGTEYLLQHLIQLFPRTSIYALENPGYEKMSLIFRSNQVAYRAVPLDASGMLPAALAQSGAAVACVTPSHQFPTGSIMPVSRRIQLLNWAQEKPDRYIVEDDYDSEFKYAGKPIPALQGMDAGGKVIYIGAFSKSLSPALRISYMVLPEQLLETYHAKLSFYLCPVPVTEQKVLNRFIRGGHFERHLNRMRIIYRTKREILTAALREQLPSARIEGAGTGLHLVLKIANGMDESELIQSANAQGVRVYGLSQYYFQGCSASQPAALLLGFATLRNKEIPEAVALLRQAWCR